MTTVYKLQVDSFHRYTGYWSSLECAFQNLSKCADFRRVLSCRLPDYAKENADRNLLTLRFEYKVNDTYNIYAVNAHCSYREYEEVKEVREPGVPYVPFSWRLVSERSEYKDVCLGALDVTPITLDEVST